MLDRQALSAKLVALQVAAALVIVTVVRGARAGGSVQPRLEAAEAQSQAPPHSRADSAESAAVPAIVLMTHDSDSPGHATTLRSVRVHLSDISIRLIEGRETARGDLRARLEQSRALATEHGALGVFWLDMDERGDTLLYLAERAGSRLLVRRIPPDLAGQSAASEEIALITRALVMGLLDGREIGMTPVVLPPRAVPRAAAPLGRSSLTASGRARRELSLGYWGTSFSSHTGWRSAARVQGSGRLSERAWIGLGAAVAWPLVQQTSEVALSVTSATADVVARYEVPLGTLQLGAVLGLMAEWTKRSTTRVSTSLAPSADASRWMFGAYAGAAARWPLYGPWRAVGTAGVDALTHTSAYVVRGASERRVDRPRALRPRAELGIGVLF